MALLPHPEPQHGNSYRHKGVVEEHQKQKQQLLGPIE